MHLTKGKMILVGSALAVGSMPMSASMAHQYKAASTISINTPDANNDFFGSVASTRGQCKRNRRVTLIKVRRNKKNRVAGRTRTDGNGNWKIPKASPQGRYRAKVARRLKTRYGHRHDCRGDKSIIIRVST